ncbi:hypothetical protein [Novipirellula caenicola]|uniref:IgGFc-binding protein N-terminal domain-containing protein n=1 Tax=Novipirellula caenicola TaxID=1536901 RepID=A0ABP9VR68_9BACT
MAIDTFKGNRTVVQKPSIISGPSHGVITRLGPNSGFTYIPNDYSLPGLIDALGPSEYHIVIPKDESSVELVLTPLADDDHDEGDKSATLEVIHASGYHAYGIDSNLRSATVVILSSNPCLELQLTPLRSADFEYLTD